MSVILVVNYNKQFYVLKNVDADTEWNEDFAKKHVNMETSKFTRSRPRALVLAHDLQKKANTEYGVREMDISFVSE